MAQEITVAAVRVLASSVPRSGLLGISDQFRKRDRRETGVNQLWIADLTYIRLLEEFVFLAAILDAFSRWVIGWALDRNLDDELTLTALRMALERRSWDFPKDCPKALITTPKRRDRTAKKPSSGPPKI